MQTKLIKVHLKTQEKVSAFVVAFANSGISPKPDNPVDWGWVNWTTHH